VFFAHSKHDRSGCPLLFLFFLLFPTRPLTKFFLVCFALRPFNVPLRGSNVLIDRLLSNWSVPRSDSFSCRCLLCLSCLFFSADPPSPRPSAPPLLPSFLPHLSSGVGGTHFFVFKTLFLLLGGLSYKCCPLHQGASNISPDFLGRLTVLVFFSLP